MTQDLGDNLKRLRKERDLTQDEFAEFIGVSFQTVSKWERNENYPDITLLGPISSFFGVTVDELLGVGREDREKKIAGYLETYERMRLKDLSGVFAEFGEAVREFPGDFRLLVRYMELLIAEKDSVRDPDFEQTDALIRRIYGQIRTRCADDGIRVWAKRLMIGHLVKLYECTGDRSARTQADGMLAELPALHDGREYLTMTMNSDAETHRSVCENAVEELMLLLDNSLVRAYYYDKNVPAKTKTAVIENYNRLLLAAVPDALYSKNGMHLIYNYGHLGYMYAGLGDDEKALEYLALAAKSAVLFDERSDVSEVVAREYEQEPVFREMRMRERMRKLMAEHYSLSDSFRSRPEFKAIIGLLD